MASTVLVTGRKPRDLLPVPKFKAYPAKDAEKLAYDVAAFGINEIRTLGVLLAEEETAQQIQIENPPAFVNVDNVRGRSILEFRRRMTISFGARLKTTALDSLRKGLIRAIQRSTRTRTGRLSSPSNWEFWIVRKGRASKLPLAGSEGIPMDPDDFIVLKPSGVVNEDGQAYATAVNMRVAGGGKLSFRRSKKAKATRRNTAIGFLALAARAAQSSRAFDGFEVSAQFTAKHALQGEVVKLAGPRSGYIKVRPKVGWRRRRG